MERKVELYFESTEDRDEWMRLLDSACERSSGDTPGCSTIGDILGIDVNSKKVTLYVLEE